ncbi:MAG: hypothetical protein U9Q21_04970 [Candidatus Auribacterota bacterium]|nr:hypothetical protein [Candidatus Auribacterota bacterium]
MKPERYNKGSINLDKDIVFKEKKKVVSKKQSKIPKMFIFAGIGLLLLLTLLFINPENSGYIDSAPPEELAVRDSVYNTILQIQQYQTSHHSLPGSDDISIPAGLYFEVQEDSSWSIESETGLYYSYDMDPTLFKLGEI